MKRLQVNVSRGLGIIVLCIVILIASVYTSTSNIRYSSVETIPAKRVGIVLGAQVRSDGTLSQVLADRVDAAVRLYQNKKISRILMSGDNSSLHYNEVVAMKQYAVAKGIPAEVIFLDYAGFSTYDTCYRAKAIFSLDEAIIISQKYHIPRAVFTCRNLGINITGFGTPDWSLYPGFMIRAQVREYLAQLKMFIQLYVTRPEPAFLGPEEIIN